MTSILGQCASTLYRYWIVFTAVEESKSAAWERAWLDGLQTAAQVGSGQQGSLFIEDALANLRMASDDDGKAGSNKIFLELGWLQEAVLVLTPLSLRYMQDVVSLQSGILYLPNNVYAAVDKLYFEGSSDLILAKKAIVSSHLYSCRVNLDIHVLVDILSLSDVCHSGNRVDNMF